MQKNSWLFVFLSFVAYGTTNTYVECTRALQHLVATYYVGPIRKPHLCVFFCKASLIKLVENFPKGLIASTDAFGAMPLESTKFLRAAAPCRKIERSINHHGCAAVKKTRQKF